MKQDRKNKRNHKGFADLVSMANDEFVDIEVRANASFISLGTNSLTNSWFLDSTCSYYMCLNRQWFDTFKYCNAGTILMGNDVTCKAIGLGTVKVHMFDGIVRILINVKYVIDLKKNLISSSTLDSLGHGSLVKDEVVMKITKCDIVIMKGKKMGNFTEDP